MVVGEVVVVDIVFVSNVVPVEAMNVLVPVAAGAFKVVEGKDVELGGCWGAVIVDFVVVEVKDN